jgi:hypothetical protein
MLELGFEVAVDGFENLESLLFRGVLRGVELRFDRLVEAGVIDHVKN